MVGGGMTAGNVGTIMDAIGTRLGTVTGLRVFDFPPKSAQAPFAFVDLPERIDFDAALKRGYDRMTVRVVVCVADQVDRAARDAIATYAAGTGSGSIKAVLENGSIGSSCRVQSVEFRPVIMAGNAFLGAVFTLDVIF
jgi:hypothetical protein